MGANLFYQQLEDTVPVIRCMNCGYYHFYEKEPWRSCCNRPYEPMVMRMPDDFCSKAVRREENEDGAS